MKRNSSHEIVRVRNFKQAEHAFLKRWNRLITFSARPTSRRNVISIRRFRGNRNGRLKTAIDLRTEKRNAETREISKRIAVSLLRHFTGI